MYAYETYRMALYWAHAVNIFWNLFVILFYFFIYSFWICFELKCVFTPNNLYHHFESINSNYKVLDILWVLLCTFLLSKTDVVFVENIFNDIIILFLIFSKSIHCNYCYLVITKRKVCFIVNSNKASPIFWRKLQY